MKRYIIIIAALAAAFSAFAQTTAEEFNEKYNRLISRLGYAGVGIETYLDKWEAAFPEDGRLLEARCNYYLWKGLSTQVVPKDQSKFLGNKPIIAIPDSTGKKVNYFEENFYDDELFGQAISWLEKAIELYPFDLVYRADKITCLLAYEKESPDMATQALRSLIDYHCTSHPSWKYGENAFSDDDFRVLFGVLLAALCEGKVAALVVRKGALVSDRHPAYGNNAVLTREEAADLILRAASPSDCFVSTTGKLSREVFELREKHGEDHRRDFLTVGSMGHASMIALGVAEAKPDRRVWCLDGDGAVLMHLGSLAVIGRRSPKNLIHVVINNGAHETVGGMPVCSGALNIEALAKAAGYRHVLRADSAATLQQAAESLASLQGPVLLEVRCACGARKDLGRPTTTPVQNRDAFMSFLNA